MRIGAHAGEGEFRHVGLGDDDRAAGAQTAHYGSVGLGRLRLFGQQLGARARRLAGDVEQILDADDCAIERPERNAGACTRVGGVGRGLRLLAIDRETGARALALRIVDARERGVEPFAGGRLSSTEPARLFEAHDLDRRQRAKDRGNFSCLHLSVAGTGMSQSSLT